jgi:hypothetical protein
MIQYDPASYQHSDHTKVVDDLCKIIRDLLSVMTSRCDALQHRKPDFLTRVCTFVRGPSSAFGDMGSNSKLFFPSLLRE